jgi:hypothetical protein
MNPRDHRCAPVARDLRARVQDVRPSRQSSVLHPSPLSSVIASPAQPGVAIHPSPVSPA